MALKVRNYAVQVGTAIPGGIFQSSNEDTQHVMTFTDAAAPLGTGLAVDLSAVTSITLTVKSKAGDVLAQVAGVVIDVPTAKVGFTVLHGSLAGAVAQPYDSDVLLVDGANKQNQLLVVTPFTVLPGIT